MARYVGMQELVSAELMASFQMPLHTFIC
uniref:Uncharacterized protein n=1 Tax=Arundo donax TaxID=35708 RepID=A0A0A8ZA79_ARUDO